jgi:hypothetical protein
MCAAHAQEAAANVEQMAAIVKVVFFKQMLFDLFTFLLRSEQRTLI